MIFHRHDFRVEHVWRLPVYRAKCGKNVAYGRSPETAIDRVTQRCPKLHFGLGLVGDALDVVGQVAISPLL